MRQVARQAEQETDADQDGHGIIVTATRDEIEEDDAFARHVLYPVWEKKNMYYDIGTAGS